VYRFVYDGQGRLTGIKDNSGNLTAIQRNGNQPTAMVGPFGHTTTLSVDSNGYLAGIQAPDGAVTALTYDSTGLMRTLTDPTGISISSRSTRMAVSPRTPIPRAISRRWP